MKPSWLTPTIETWILISLIAIRVSSSNAVEEWRKDEWDLLIEQAKRLSKQWESFWRYLEDRRRESSQT